MKTTWIGLIRAVVLFAVLTIIPARFAHAAPPNILFIVVDDLGWMDLGCQGNHRLITPRADSLAKQGVLFTNAYAAAPVCSPTRGALITGLAPARLHITQHGKDIPAFWPKDRPIQPPVSEYVLPLKTLTIAERLKELGYATGFFGKWHLAGEFDPNDPRCRRAAVLARASGL
jgi:arylsulfatase A